jgi:3-oxoadipate enol-lactonase
MNQIALFYLLLATALALEQQRYLLTKSSSPTKNPPLVLLPGMAQSIEVYEHHLRDLSKEQDVLIVEAVGLGKWDPLDNDVSLASQADRLIETIDRVGLSEPVVNLAGFSLGGRIALAAAGRFPDRFRKIHLTGVAKAPSEHALVSYHAWRQLLRHAIDTDTDLTASGFGWSALLGTYSPGFLHQNESRLATWVKSLSETHTAEGLLALLEQTHDPEWSVERMTQRFTGIQPGHLCVGQDDRFATLEQVSLLAQDLGWQHSVLPGGHAVPMEQPRPWRDNLLAFLRE